MENALRLIFAVVCALAAMASQADAGTVRLQDGVGGYTGTYDAWLKYNSHLNYGGSQYFKVESYDNSVRDTTVIKFNLPSVTCSGVASADLSLYYSLAESMASDEGMLLAVSRINPGVAWDENVYDGVSGHGVNWDHRNDPQTANWSGPLGGGYNDKVEEGNGMFAVRPAGGTWTPSGYSVYEPGSWTHVSVLPSVLQWPGAENDGFVVWCYTQATPHNYQTTTADFASRNDTSSSPVFHPTLTINYQNASIVWTGATSGAWNATTANWHIAGLDGTYNDGDNVTFGDGAANTAVTIATGGVTPGSVTVSGALNYSFSGSAIMGSGGIAKSGSGTLTLMSANSYGGTTAISQGVVNIRHASALGTNAGGTTVADGAALELQGTGFTVTGEALSLAGSGPAGGGALRNVSGTNGWTGQVTLAGTTNTLGVDAGTLTLSGKVTGAHPLTKVGTGYLVLTGATNDYSGGTSILRGRVVVDEDVHLGDASGGVTIDNLATLEINGTFATGRAFTMGSGNGLIQVDTNCTLTLNGTVGGAGGLASQGVLVLAGSGNNYAGSTSIVMGTLRLSGDGRIPDTSNVVTGGNLDLNGISDTVNALSGGGNVTNSGGTASTLTVGAAGGSATFNGHIQNGAGAVALVKSGAGTQVLTATNPYTGTTTVSAGVLNVRAGDAIGSGGAGVTVADTAALELEGAGFAVSGKPLYLAGSGPGGGGAMRNISGANKWAGAITLTAATIIQSDAGSLGLTDITGAGNNLVLQGSAGESTGAITTGGGSLTKSGGGTWTLGGTCTYTGQTLIRQGTLALRDSGSIADSPTIDVQGGAYFDASAVGGGFTLLPGQTLKGNGTVIGVMTVGGMLSPGESPGTLYCDSVVFESTGQFREELYGGMMKTYDELAVNGTVDLTGAELVASLGYAPLKGTRYWIITGADDLDGTFDGLPQGATFELMGPLGKMYEFTISYEGDMLNNRLTGGHDVVLVVPEPATLALVIGGMGAMWLVGRRRRAAVR